MTSSRAKKSEESTSAARVAQQPDQAPRTEVNVHFPLLGHAHSVRIPPVPASLAGILTMQKVTGNRMARRMLTGQQLGAVGRVSGSIQQQREGLPEPSDEAARRVVTEGSVSPSGGTPPPIQTKLTLDSPGDKHEEEADQIAERALSYLSNTSQKPLPPILPPVVHRTMAVEGKPIPRDIEESIQQRRGGGQPLPESVRNPMEQAFEADFGEVRVHTDAQSDALNRSLQARAFTTGKDLFFRQGEYNPQSSSGMRLIAHELTHVLQQRGSRTSEAINRNPDQDRQEFIVGNANYTKRSGTESTDALADEIITSIKTANLSKDIMKRIDNNLHPIRAQIIKWIRYDSVNHTTSKTEPSLPHQLYGRKKQDRRYANFEDLAKGLLGWIEAKPIRRIERQLAEDVYTNRKLSKFLDSLILKAWVKIRNLGNEQLKSDPERAKQIQNELETGVSEINKKEFGHYRNYFGELKGKNLASNVPLNRFEMLENPEGYSIKDKIVLLHDLMEYFGIHQRWNPKSAGQDLLPKETDAETMVTIKVDQLGNRTEGESVITGGKRARGIGLTNATRDENAPSTILGRDLGLPLWAGQSMTAVRMLKLAQWVGANTEEMTALALNLFAFWRLEYDHSSKFAYHTLHEVMDMAQNFGVSYRAVPGGGYNDYLALLRTEFERATERYNEMAAITEELVNSLMRDGYYGTGPKKISMLLNEVRTHARMARIKKQALDLRLDLRQLREQEYAPRLQEILNNHLKVGLDRQKAIKDLVDSAVRLDSAVRPVGSKK